MDMTTAPGPWTTSSRKGRAIVIDADRNEVCEAHAAAALIAAAPELLEALQAILDVDHPDSDYFRMVQRVKRIARAAIAKATA